MFRHDNRLDGPQRGATEQDEQTRAHTSAFSGVRTAQVPAPADPVGALAREKERYGGVKIGAAFFGWLTAIGAAVLLTGLASAAGVAVSVATNTGLDSVPEQVDTLAPGTIEAIGLVSGLVLLLALFVAFFCGGYVAGRMARFNGARQGFAVWLWAIVMAVVVALVGSLAGSHYDVFAQADLPRIPVNDAQFATGGLLALVLLTVGSLVGAVLGGLAGMRFHRMVDRAGLGR